MHPGLAHLPPDCAGGWERILWPDGAYWRCSACFRTHPETLRSARDIAWDRHLGGLLQKLTREGRGLLRRGD